MSIDLRGSDNPIDDLNAIKNCYNVIASMIMDSEEYNPIYLADLMFILDSFMGQSIDNLIHNEKSYPGNTQQELLDISSQFAKLAQDKDLMEHVSKDLCYKGQPLNTLTVSALLNSIELREKSYKQKEANQ